MEMIDILQKLREYQEAGHKIDDAIANVEKTNPAQTEGRVKDMVMDMEQDAAEMSREEFIKKHGKSYVDIYDRVQKEKSYEGKEMKKEKIDESVMIATDTPEEASMMMQILKLAGVQPVDQAMINQPEKKSCGCDSDCACQQEEAYANEPEEKMQSVDDLVNTHSGGLNRQKQTFPKVAGGDNPMQKTTEELADNLRAQYNTFKENYAKAIEEAKAKSPYAIGMAQAMKSTGDKPPLEKSTIKKAHDIAKSIEKKS